MDIVSLLVTLLLLALVGFVVYLITTYIPMPDLFKTVIVVACAVLIILYLISVVAGYGGLPRVHLR